MAWFPNFSGCKIMSLLRMLLSASSSSNPYTPDTEVLSSSPADNAGFGGLVALSGDGLTMLSTSTVGGSADKVVYVYTRSGPTWTLQQAITISDPGLSYSLFSAAMSADGNLLVVGAPLRDTGSSFSGAVWIYVRGGGSWSLQQKITGSAGFGRSVSLTPVGTTLAVGCDTDNGDRGAVFVYTGGPTWSLQQKLTASDASISDYLGYSVAVAGDTLIAGAPGEGPNVSDDPGACYVFTRSGSTWTQQAKLAASPATSDGVLGEWVGISADESTLVATARSYDDAVSCGSGTPGAAYAWTGSGASWTQMNYFTLGCRGVGSGGALSSDGSILMLRTITSGALILSKSGSTWTQVQYLRPTIYQAGDQIGVTVGMSADGRHVIAGAPARSTSPYVSNGSVFYFYR